MRSKIIYPLAVIFLCACSVLKKNGITQGIAGHIYIKTGNQMPPPGQPLSKGRGVSRDIYIYKPTTTNDILGNLPLFPDVKTQLVGSTRSNSAGAYQINLPMGTYSVFIKEDGKLFGAITDGNGVINPVIVTKDGITQFNLTITTNATF